MMQFRYKKASPGQQAYIQKELDKEIKKEAKQAVKGATNEIVIQMLACTMQVLHDEFGFGDKRMMLYKDKVQEQFDLVNQGYVDRSDFRDNFRMIEK